MNQPLGYFCLVLHGHLPWVMNHGRWPHGEDWLFEAASETYLPLLGAMERLGELGVRPAWTLGMTPILLEQLGSARFKEGFPRWLAERRARALSDATEFQAENQGHLQYLAELDAAHFGRLAEHFAQLGGDIAKALQAVSQSQIELLSSNATHGFHPLILHDACARAQVRAGLATSERHLGRRPKGVWLPECAYRPPGLWWPAAVHGLPREQEGVASIYEEAGVSHFFVDTHLVTGSTPVARLVDGRVDPVQGDLSGDVRAAWGSPLEPLRVVERDRVTNVTVLARHPELSEQVWSGEVGYPGDGRYREFHKQHGLRGLRYWRVSGSGVDLGAKEPYVPEQAADAARSHAAHFVARVEAVVKAHHAQTGRAAVVCAPFDAELFGHWWHEGPDFLVEVARRLSGSSVVQAATVAEALRHRPADRAATMPEGTWGAGGDTRVWLNDELRIYWEIAYHAEDRFIDMWWRSGWEEDAEARRWLVAAGRELLLLQASDWAFVISTRGAVDYGLRRISGHAALFDDLCNGLEDHLAGAAVDPICEDALRSAALHDDVFPDLDLGWWR